MKRRIWDRWLAATKAMTVCRKRAREVRVRSMMRRTQSVTEILARPIPMMLSICAMVLHLIAKGRFAGGMHQTWRPIPS